MTKNIRLSIRIDDKMAKQLKEVQEKFHEKFISDVVRLILKIYLENREK